MVKYRGTFVLAVKQISIVAVIGLAASLPGVAMAELEEIVVTARKRSVALENAAIAVAVVSGEDFDKSNITRLDDFNGYVPGLVVAKNDGAGRIVTIRGLGWETAQNLATQPSVLAYVDGIYRANSLSMGLDLGEIDRVEVYRGPQGTEFGQGTTGGAINIVSKTPQIGARTGSAEISYGTYDTIRARATINVPLSRQSAVRASLQKFDRDGFAEIRGGALDGYDLDDADSLSAKLALLAEPSDAWSILLQAGSDRSDQHAAAQKNIDDPNPDPRELTQDFPGIFKLDNNSLSMTVNWQSGSGLAFKSLTGWQELTKRQSVDGDRLTEATISIDRLGFFVPDNWDVLTFWDNESEAFSQEFNLSYRNDKIDWLVGVYYLDHDNFNDFLEATGPAPFSDSISALANPSPATLPPFASVLSFNEQRTVTREDTAVYGQTTVRLTDQVAVTGGIRYQAEKQRDFGRQFFGLFGDFDRSTNDSETTWKAGIDVQLSENQLIYGLISTGWKNGGTNPGAISNGAMFLTPGFAPEEVTSFEIGSRNLLADKSIRLNVTAFFYDHRHMQFNFEDPVPFAGGTGTIPELDEYGIESEFSWNVADAWQIDGVIAWQRGEVKSDVFVLDAIDFREALSPGVGLFTAAGFDERVALATQTNLNGNTPAKLPSLVTRVAISNERDAQRGVFSSRLEWLHRGEMQARVFNHPQFDTIPAYSIVNLHFRYDLTARPITVSVSATNLFDEDGVNNTFNNPFGVWSTSNEYIPPQEVLVTFRYEWE